MAEELRILVIDSGGNGAPRGRTAPAATVGGGANNVPSSIPRPPKFVTPPSLPGQSAKDLAARERQRRTREMLALGAVASARNAGSALAAGNVGGAAAVGTGAAVSAIGGPVGIGIAAVAAGFVVAAIAAKKFAQVIESQTNKLAGFSGPLSAAQAQTEISREAALRRRAARIGPELARAERLRAKF